MSPVDRAGRQDTRLTPAIAPLAHADRRAAAFGPLDACFGTARPAGTVVFTLLYSRSLPALVAASLVAQLTSRPVFVAARRAAAVLASDARQNDSGRFKRRLRRPPSPLDLRPI